MIRGVFVTGTDTGVGKTHTAVSLVVALRSAGHRVGVMKPVAAGVIETNHGPRNEDAVALAAASAQPVEYDFLNPYLFEEPIAPHIAAEDARVAIDPALVAGAYAELASRSDVMVVEGAGGWLVPIDDRRTVADVAAAIGLPVLLVVGMRLGCLNHALLSAEAIASRGLTLVGWVANCIDPEMRKLDRNIAALEHRLAAPLVATLPWEPSATPESNAHRFALETLGFARTRPTP